MNLLTLLRQQKNTLLEHRVPDWMMGCFQRRSISFYNGLTDCDTRVFWLQTQTLTIDLRLPIKSEQTSYDGLITNSPKLNFEGWYAESVWENDMLSWRGGDCYQLHNRWPEPAILKRIGNCMVEFSPTGAYVEDWRLLSTNTAPLIGLELVKEENHSTGQQSKKQGALIICGQQAGLVVGRAKQLDSKSKSLIETVRDCSDKKALDNLLDFETSVAIGNIDSGYIISDSLDMERVGQPLFDVDSFELEEQSQLIVETVIKNNETIKRFYQVETFIENFNFTQDTKTSKASEQWYAQEKNTLERYTRQVF